MKELTDNKQSRALEYIVANLLDFFRDPKNQGRFLEAAALVENVISQMGSQRGAPLQRRFCYYASKLKNNVTPKTLRAFAQECLDCAFKYGTFQSASALNNGLSKRTLHKKAEKQLNELVSEGHSLEAAVQRTANHLLKSRKSSDAIGEIDRLVQSHPLKDTLEIFTAHGYPMAKEDIKNKLLRLKKRHNNERRGDGTLFGLLETAQAFSISRLHRLLGDELFFLCRPLGFLDLNATVLIIEVPTSAHLHALTYQKLEILSRLRHEDTFAVTKTIKFRVSSYPK